MSTKTTIHYEPQKLKDLIYKADKALNALVLDDKRLCEEIYRQMVTALSQNNKHVFWPWSKEVYSPKECEELIQATYYSNFRHEYFTAYHSDWNFEDPRFIRDFSMLLTHFGKIRDLFQEWNKDHMKYILEKMSEVGNKVLERNRHYNNVWKLFEMKDKTFDQCELVVVEQLASDSLYWFIEEGRKLLTSSVDVAESSS